MSQQNYPFIVLVLLCSLIAFSTFTTEIHADLEPHQIKTYKADVTGNGLEETIELKGELLSSESSYYREIWAEIKSIDSRKWRIPFQGGYEPHIEFLDLTHDFNNDILYQSETKHSLMTFKNGHIVEGELPKLHYIEANFLKDFKVEIKSSIDKQPIIEEVRNDAAKYVEQGVYNKQGALLQKEPLIIDDIDRFESVLISKSKGYGLKSYQAIKGIHEDDLIGKIEILWLYENDEWIILETKWVTAK